MLDSCHADIIDKVRVGINRWIRITQENLAGLTQICKIIILILNLYIVAGLAFI